MNCKEVVSENRIERYLDGTLDAETRDAFELHYFHCESCLSMLQTVQAVRPLLTDPGASGTKAKAMSATAGIWLAAAAALALILLLRPWDAATPVPVAGKVPSQAEQPQKPTAPASIPLLQLAQIQPAPYSPAVFRDASSPLPPKMEQAMRLYQDRKWAAAAAALSPLAAPPLRLPAAQHFAGVSLLLAGQTEPALIALNAAIALGDKSPFEEEARFYRAQALLVAGRGAEARLELDRLIQMQGDYEKQARSLREKL